MAGVGEDAAGGEVRAALGLGAAAPAAGLPSGVGDGLAASAAVGAGRVALGLGVSATRGVAPPAAVGDTAAGGGSAARGENAPLQISASSPIPTSPTANEATNSRSAIPRELTLRRGPGFFDRLSSDDRPV
jgi:hypothetical protein